MFTERIARKKNRLQIMPVLAFSLLAFCSPSVFAKPVNIASSGSVIRRPNETRLVDLQQPALSPQPAQPATELLPGKLVKREISGKVKQSFQFDLAKDQYASLAFAGSAFAGSVKLFDASGEAILEYDFKHTAPAQQTIEIVAEAAGRYRLDVEGGLADSAVQTYTIQLTAVHAASDQELWSYQADRFHFRAGALKAAQKYDEALALEEKALRLRKQTFGTTHPAVAESLHQLGRIYYFKADYPPAEIAYLHALAIREKTSGPVSNDIFELCNNLGALYNDMGELDKAEQFMQRAVAVQQKLSNADDMMKARALHNLALVYYNKGEYDRAEPLYQRALAIEQKEFGAEGPQLTDTLDNLSVMYEKKGDYLKAESFAQRSLAIEEKAFGPDDPNTASTVLNLGNLRYFIGELDQAEPLYQRALVTFEKTLGPEHPLVALALNNLAEVYHDRHEFAKAEPLYLRSLQVREKKLGKDHSDVGQSLNNLGSLYGDQGDYVRAEEFFRRALDNRVKALGPDHPDVVSTLSNMSRMYMASGNFTKAEDFEARAITTSERNARLNLVTGSERQKRAYLDLLSEQLDRAITLNVSYAPEQAAARDLAVTTLLQRKGLIQDALSDSLASLRTRVSTADLKLLDQFNETTAKLSRLVLSGRQLLSPEEFRKRIATLNDQREQLEAEVSRHSAEFRAQSVAVTLDAIRAAVPDKTALVEFVSYKPLLTKGITVKERYGPPRYVAYVIRNRGEVEWKELGDAKAINSAIEDLRQSLRDPRRKDVPQRARAVDEKVMQPVRSLLAEEKLLLISPDGELNLIPFGALVDEQGHFLIERYSFSYLTSGRELLRLREARESKSQSLVIADPLFGEPAAESIVKTNSTSKAPTPAARRRSVTSGTALSELYFAPLGGTGEEARAIQTLFPEARIRTGTEATEFALKRVVAPRILHIATHGFFLQDMKTETNSALPVRTAAPNAGVPANTSPRGSNAGIDNPLLRSGLALSGANLRNSDNDDGILTALEASGLNLWGTKLVVLSACDTGLGEVRNGEGVYGLRRAFVLAGAESLVMSLWPISDYTTRHLMTEYYKNLKQGLGRGEALRQVQLEMLKKNPQLHPFYWANFIQAGEWANLDGKR
jgi:CHAT domain-containing protein/Tfp pilus assembly protein PilF